MRRAEARATDLLRDEGGAVYVEFLLAFLPLFLFFMGMLQMAVLYAAALLVEHAADRAARAAATILDDDPAYYGDERRGSVAGSDLDPAALRALYLRHALRPDSRGWVTFSRRAAITATAAMPLFVLVPHPPSTSLSAVASDLTSRLDVTLHAPSTWSGGIIEGVVTSDEIEVRVSFRYACAIPVGGRMVCGDGREHVLTASARRAVHRAGYPYVAGTP